MWSLYDSFGMQGDVKSELAVLALSPETPMMVGAFIP